MNSRKLRLFMMILVTVLLGAVWAHGDEDGNPTVWVANGTNGTLSVVDRVTGEELARVSAGRNPHVLSVSPDGRFIYVINAGAHDMSEAGSMSDTLASNSLWVFAADTGEVVARVAVGQGPTHPVASPDGQRVYVTNTDEDSVSVIDTSSWQVTDTLTGLPEPHDGEVTPDSRYLYLATAGNNSLSVVDTRTLELAGSFAVGAKPRGVVIGGATGETAYVTNKGDGTLSIVEVPTGMVTTLTVGKGAHALRLSPAGNTLYVALSGENSVALLDLASGKVTQRIAVGAGPEQLDLSADGTFLAVSNGKDATLSLIDLAQARVINTTPVGQGVFGVQFSNLPFDTE